MKYELTDIRHHVTAPAVHKFLNLPDCPEKNLKPSEWGWHALDELDEINDDELERQGCADIDVIIDYSSFAAFIEATGKFRGFSWIEHYNYFKGELHLEENSKDCNFLRTESTCIPALAGNTMLELVKAGIVKMEEVVGTHDWQGIRWDGLIVLPDKLPNAKPEPEIASDTNWLVPILIELTSTPSNILEEAIAVAGSINIDPIAYMVEHQVITTTDIARAYAMHFGFEHVLLDGMEIPPEVIARVPREFACRHLVMPISSSGEHHLKIALTDPSNVNTIDAIGHRLNMSSVKICVASTDDVITALVKYYQVDCSAVRQ